MERRSICRFKERLHKFTDHNTFCSITFNNGDITFVSEISYIAKGQVSGRHGREGPFYAVCVSNHFLKYPLAAHRTLGNDRLAHQVLRSLVTLVCSNVKAQKAESQHILINYM